MSRRAYRSVIAPDIKLFTLKVDRSPHRFSHITLAWWSYMRYGALFACPEGGEVLLRLDKTRLVSATTVCCKFELDGIVLPKADRAYVVASGSLIENEVAAARTRESLASSRRRHGRTVADAPI
jgi:hypothetical protein